MARKSNNSVKAIETLTPSTFVANDPIVQSTTLLELDSFFVDGVNVTVKEGRRLMTQEEIEQMKEENGTSYLTDYTVPVESELGNALIENLNAEIEKEIANENLKPYYMTVQMNIAEAQVLTPRAVLMNQQVSTTEAIAFTDNIKSVRSIIRKMNKKGERQYTAILKEATLYVWRTL